MNAKKILIHDGLVVTKDFIGEYDIVVRGEKIELLGVRGSFSGDSFDEKLTRKI